MNTMTSGAAGHLFLIVGTLLAVVAIAHMLRHRRSPSATIAWLLIIILFHYLGVALYLLFGSRKQKMPAIAPSDQPPVESSEGMDREASQLNAMLQRFGIPAATTGNRVSLCPTGVEGLNGLKYIIDEAKSSLHVQTFIFSDDDVGHEILHRLTDKAGDGVEVRLLVDGLGSLKTRRSLFRPLVEAGGEFAVFKPVLHVPFRGHTNLRNHRKIAISDGCRVLAGGMNITGEDMFSEASADSWQDLSFIVEGPAATHYQTIFRSDWRLATGKQLALEPCVAPGPQGEAVVQVVPSGPDVPQDPLYATTITAAYRAQRRLWIVTPYFVPDDSLVQALAFACRRGLDVRILVPEKSNHRFSDVARAAFLREIESEGGKVLLYTDGMVHAKIMLVDEDLAMVGSANLDMRSLFLNYEVMQLSYSAKEVQDVEHWIEGLFARCREGVPKASVTGEIVEGLVRTISPLF